MNILRVTNHPAFVYRGVLVTEPPGHFVRVHFTEATMSFDSGPRLVSTVGEARACVDKWHAEMRERLPRLTPGWEPSPGEGQLASDEDDCPEWRGV